MRQLQIIALLLWAIIPLAAAAGSPPTFCKCTCFKNYTIIPLGPEHQQDNSRLQLRSPFSSEEDKLPLEKRTSSSSCSKCTKSFCRDDQSLPFCKDATDDDIQTMCFQRDSNKDKIIVWGFLLGTTGLLGWAAFKKMAESREAKDNVGSGRAQYARVGETSQEGPHH